MKHRLQRISICQELTNPGIDALSESLRAGLASVCKDPKNINLMCLSAEEALLSWQEHFGTEHICRLTLSQRFRTIQIQLELVGDRFDPTDNENLSEYGRTILTRLGLSPSFSYQKGRNTLCYRLKTGETNPLVPIATATVLAIVCGFLGNYLSPEVRDFVSVQVLQRLQDTFFGILSMVAMPLIFCSLITGICGIGDTATLSGTGMRLVNHYYIDSLISTAVAAIIMGALFGLRMVSDSGFAGNLTAFLDMIFSMIPSNIVGAFYDGSFTQIMLLAVAIGIAMLILGEQAKTVLQIVEQFQRIFDMMLRWVCKVLPVGIFSILVINIWSNSVEQLLQIWKPMILSGLLLTGYMVFELCVVSLRVKLSPVKLWKKLTPSFVIAFTSASSTAAYKEIIGCCHEDLGIRKKMVDFGVPLGLGVSSPGSSIAFITATVYALCLAQTSTTPANLAMGCVLCTLLMMASPSTAGGPVSCFSVMFAHFMIPEYVLGPTILVYLILDFYSTGINVASKALILLNQAWKEDQVDRSVLHR